MWKDKNTERRKEEKLKVNIKKEKGNIRGKCKDYNKILRKKTIKIQESNGKMKMEGNREKQAGMEGLKNQKEGKQKR